MMVSQDKEGVGKDCLVVGVQDQFHRALTM